MQKLKGAVNATTIGIAALAILVVVLVYFGTKGNGELSGEELGDMMVKEEASIDAMKKEVEAKMISEIEKMDFDYEGELSDVTESKDILEINTKGEAQGVARQTFKDGVYSLSASFENLPDPKGEAFYEGWLVRRSPFKFISSGKAVKSGEKYLNVYSSGDDLTAFDFYVLTLEPDDKDPKPAFHILEGVMKKKEKAEVKGESTETNENSIKNPVFSGAVLAGKDAPLLDFKKEDYDQALASGKIVVLYFYADWCPVCKEEFPKMMEAFNSLASDKVVGFRVNFMDSFTDNSERELANQSGAHFQHTKVIMKNGKNFTFSTEEWSKERYLSEINKAL